MTTNQKQIFSFRKNKAVKGLASAAIAVMMFGNAASVYANETTQPVTPETTVVAQSSNDYKELIAEKDKEISQLDTEVTELTQDVSKLKDLSENADKIPAEIEAKENSITVAEETKTASETVLSEQTQVKEDKSNELDSLEKEITQVTDELNETKATETEIKEDVKELSDTIETKTSEVSNVSKEITTLQGQNTKDEASIKAMETILKEDKVTFTAEEVNNALSDLSTKTEELANIKEDITTVNSELTEVTEKLNEVPRKMVLSDAYIKALQDYYNYSLTSDERAAAKRILAQEGKILNQTTTSDYFNVFFDEVSEEKFNINNLPQEVLVELNEYAKEIVNDVRKQVGQKEVVLSNSSIDFAKRVTDEYNKQNWSFGQGHSSIAVNTAGQHYNLKYTENTTTETGSQAYEDFASFGNDRQEYSLGQLKTLVFLSLHNFVVNEREWLHAGDITGLRNSKTNETTTYFGLSFNQSSDLTSVHVLQVDAEDIQEPSVFDKTYNNPNSKEALQERKENLEQAVSVLTIAEKEKQAEVTSAQEFYELTKEGFQNALDNEALRNKISVLTKDIENRTAQVDTLAKDKETLQEEVDTLTKDKESKEAVLTTIVEPKVEELTNKLNELTSRKGSLVSDIEMVTKEITKAQGAIQKATKEIDTLKQEIEELKTLQNNLADAPKLIAEKEALLKEKEEKLSELRKEKETLVGLYNEAVKKETPVVSPTVTPVIPSVINSPEEPKVKNDGQTKTVTTETPSTDSVKATSTTDKTLPKTGDVGTIALQVIGAISLAGATVLKRKRK